MPSIPAPSGRTPVVGDLVVHNISTSTITVAGRSMIAGAAMTLASNRVKADPKLANELCKRMVANPDPTNTLANTIRVYRVVDNPELDDAPAALLNQLLLSPTRKVMTADEVRLLAQSSGSLDRVKRSIKNYVELPTASLVDLLRTRTTEILTINGSLQGTLSKHPIGTVLAVKTNGGNVTQHQIPAADTKSADEFTVSGRVLTFDTTNVDPADTVAVEYTGLPVGNEHVAAPTTASVIGTYRINLDYPVNAWLDGVYSRAIAAAQTNLSLLPISIGLTGAGVTAITVDGKEMRGRLVALRREINGDADNPAVELRCVFLAEVLKDTGRYPTDAEVEQALDAYVEGSLSDRLTGYANIAEILFQRNAVNTIVQSATDMVATSMSGLAS